MRHIVLSVFVWFSIEAQAKHHEIVACIDDHPPYQILADKPSGTHIDALRALSHLLQKHLVFIESPNFARCLLMLERGTVDVIAGLNPTQERDAFAFYAPFKAADSLKVISKQGYVINTYEDFEGKVIGVPRGATYFERFDDDITLKKVSIQNNRIGFALLQKDRIDLMMTSPEMLAIFADEIKAAKLVVSPIELADLRRPQTYFGFSKRNKLGMSAEELIKKVTDAYQRGAFLAKE